GGGGDTFLVPFYPFTPLLFCAVSAAMLYAALAYTGFGALVGVGAVALGLPLWWAARRAPGGCAP
ncbi:MAG: amino acid permease, partial [Proteobacteria bacterium]|nr:amino acid permease [Pseudomonadota bacterium]